MATQLREWQALPEEDPSLPAARSRFVVTDVESSGLDLAKDRLIAIGAVVIQDGAILLDQSFEMVLRQTTASGPQNILVHRIGSREQTTGCNPQDALIAFLSFARKSTLVGFHTHFGDAMIKRAFRDYLGIDWSRPWLDLIHLAPVLASVDSTTPMEKPRNLDDWLHRFNIQIAQRHLAAADALGTAQLFQVLLHFADSQGAKDTRALFEVARTRRWLRN